MTPDEKQELLDRACQALRVYKKRGEQAIGILLDDGLSDEFFRLLRRRDAAFHNFLALDAKARSSGLDVAEDPLAQRLWQSIKPVNGQLADLIQTSRDTVAATLKRLGQGRQAVHAYGARGPHGERLRKLV